MEVPSSEEDGFIREWAPYTKLLSKIPTRFLNGLFSQELSFTSIDIVDEYLAIGTNAGFAYWINRKIHDVQKLKCESTHPITFVKIVSTVDFMVAAGNKIGQVAIFQIPKEHPDSVPESLKPKVERKVERYTVRDLHQGDITFLEWSKNGMKLFSGDTNGIVVVTEIDFYMHLCKSVEIVNETYEIVQISYYQNNLLISSVYRTILCTKKDSKWDINQVGKKERKSLCKLGSIFNINFENPSKASIYCSRPGLRIWKADIDGNVLQTLLFKDAITNPSGIVELLNPALKKRNISDKECNFGPIMILKENYLVTYNDDYLYILDPRTLTAVAVIDELRKINSVAINKGEIFVLEGDRSIVRLAYVPEFEYNIPVENIMTKSLTNTLQYAVETVQNLAPALILSTLLDSNVDDTNVETIQPAEECFELPPIINLPFDINTSIATNENQLNSNNQHHNAQESDYCDSPIIIKQRTMELQKKLELYQKINEIEFEKELIHSSKRNKKKDSQTLKDMTSDSKDANIEEEIKHNTIEEKEKFIKPDLPILSHFSEGNRGFLPDDRSPETIERELEKKEKLLAKILDLEPITIVSPSCYLPKDNLSFHDQISSNKNNIHQINIKYPGRENSIPNLTFPNNPTTNNKPTTNNNTLYIEYLPQSVSIPNTWNLQKIEIDSISFKNSNKPNEQKSSDELSDNDWEIV